ncbi:hypothetical protein [Kordiimonas gwangyangensis]|uniref:hypothetical protein n=2 Tax=Kordiimonas gwangyangensis TaxID=288022 RepID=UPI000373CCB3|nr:hypothetical protein [Kordiimonas gwangyangensis]
MNTFVALVKREVLDGKNGYIRVPVILAGLTVLLVICSSLGFGNMLYFDGMEHEGIENLADAMNKAAAREPDEFPAAITIGYWMMSVLAWVALPFVIFFSLLGALYEERRDRSILFWKSMPVSDWQEVLAKFFTPIVVAPIAFLGVAIVAQLVIAVFLSILMVFQGGPVLDLWPVGLMITSWFGVLSHFLISMIWALPLLAWVLFVSAYASRMPFLWAILPPFVVMIVEELFLDSHVIASWVGTHMGGWQDGAFRDMPNDFDGPRDLLMALVNGLQWQGLSYSFANPQFWLGIVIAGGFLWGAVELRKRAI